MEIFKLRFYLLATGLTGLEFVFILTFQRCEQEVVLYDAEDGGEEGGCDGHQVTALHVTVDDRGGCEMSNCLLVLQDDGHYRQPAPHTATDQGQEQENKK